MRQRASRLAVLTHGDTSTSRHVLPASMAASLTCAEQRVRFDVTQIEREHLVEQLVGIYRTAT